MPDAIPSRPADPQPVPDPAKLLPKGGLSEKYKRWIYFGITGFVLLIVLANLVGSHGQSQPKPERATNPAQQQNPTPAQIRDWENNLRQAESGLQEETKREQMQMTQARAIEKQGLTRGPAAAPITADDLQRAAAIRDTAEAPNVLNGNGGGTPGRKSQIETERAQLAYKSLFADSIVRQQLPPQSPRPQSASDTPSERSTRAFSSPTPSHSDTRTAALSDKDPLDFDPGAQPDYWLPEGTILEAVLTNRLDGEASGPVNCMITTNVYVPGTRILVIPQGARVLGEANRVSSFGQQRLAVSFHRILVPGLHTYAIPLDKKPGALGQSGEVGLHDKVNSHYLSIFGASLAVGAVGGLAQIGNGYGGFTYDPSVQFRNGVSESMAQSSARILDHFLNRMPSVTIREGTRVKIILTGDLELPAYESTHTGGK